MKVPPLDDLLANLIDTPFDALRGQINNAFPAVASTFNPAQLPLPAVRTVHFYNNVDTSIVEDIGRPLVHLAETSALILLGLVIAVAIGNALVEWYRFRQVQNTIKAIQTPLLLEELRFPLSSLPTRTLLFSTPSASRPSVLARPSFTRGFRLQP